MAVALVDQAGNVEAVAVSADYLIVDASKEERRELARTISEGGHLVHVGIDLARIMYARKVRVTVTRDPTGRRD